MARNPGGRADGCSQRGENEPSSWYPWDIEMEGEWNAGQERQLAPWDLTMQQDLLSHMVALQYDI